VIVALTFYAVSLDFTHGIATAAADDFMPENALDLDGKHGIVVIILRP
jgi:hypothetical protein